MANNKRVKAVAAAIPLLFVLAGCAGGAAPAATEGSGGSSDAVAAAEKEVAAAQETLTEILTAEPLSGSVEGKTLAFAAASFPVAEPIGAALEEAATTLGMKFTKVDIGATPDTVAAGMNQIVQDKPDAVVVLAFDPNTFWKSQAKELEAAGIPTVGLGYIACDSIRIECEGDDVGSSLSLVSTPESEAFGKLEAAAIIAESGGTANAVYFGDPQLGNSAIIAKSFTERIEECPDCTAETVDLSAADIGTTAPSQIVSYLQSHPEVKYVSLQFGDFAIGVPQALKAAGLTDVKIISQASSKAQYDDISAGGSQFADIPVPFPYLSYVAVDSVARLLLDQEITAEQVATPLIVMDKENLDLSDGGYWPGVEGYKAQFEELWSANQ